MGILRVLLILVEVVTCLMLVGVILLQKSKGEGLGTAFGGGMSESLFGARAGNVLTKITVTLSLIFLANTALLGVVFRHQTETSIIDRRTVPVSAAPLAPMQGGEPIAMPAQSAPASAALLGDDSAPVAPSAPVDAAPLAE